MFDSQEQEELSLLRHNVRVLKGSLEVETKLARDYYNEVCAKIEEHEQLKKNYFQLESKLGCLQELEDLKDELAHTSVDLASAQKALVSYMDRAASAERYKEKVADLEEKLKDYEQISMQLDDAKLVCFLLIYTITVVARIICIKCILYDCMIFISLVELFWTYMLNTTEFAVFSKNGNFSNGKGGCFEAYGTVTKQGHN